MKIKEELTKEQIEQIEKEKAERSDFLSLVRATKRECRDVGVDTVRKRLDYLKNNNTVLPKKKNE